MRSSVAARVDAVRIDREARVLAREALVLRGEPELLAREIEQIRGVAAVHHAECRLEPDLRGVAAQQPVGDRMERPGPRQPRDGRALWPRASSPPVALATIRRARRIISCDARRENVSSRMRSGATPFSTRCATRCASVFVLPVPAPAMMSSGPAARAALVELAVCRRRALRAR